MQLIPETSIYPAFSYLHWTTRMVTWKAISEAAGMKLHESANFFTLRN